MYSNKTIIQAVDYQKTLFENSYAIMTSLQNQGQQMMTMAFEYNSLLPDSGKQMYFHWSDFMRQNSETCQEYVESSFDRVKEFFAEEALASASKKTKATKKSS